MHRVYDNLERLYVMFYKLKRVSLTHSFPFRLRSSTHEHVQHEDGARRDGQQPPQVLHTKHPPVRGRREELLGRGGGSFGRCGCCCFKVLINRSKN